MRTPVRSLITALGLIAFAAADHQATAQQSLVSADQSSASSAPTDEVRHRPEVIVTGDRAEFETKIGAYVNQLTDFEYGDSNRGLARWQEPVCPLVTGLPRPMAEYVLLRVSDIARAAGAPLAGEHCIHRNLFIIVTKQPESYLRELEKRHGADVFGAAAPILINEFIATPRPVRTWYDTVEMTPDGLPMVNMGFPGQSGQNTKMVALGVTQTSAVRPNDPTSTLTNSWSQASHLVLNVVWAMKRAYVVVDPTKFTGVKLGQLADYIAMAGLAQIKLDPKLADDPTILTLFDRAPEQASPGLTDWDQAFLKSFYSSEQKSVLQRSVIAQDMVHVMAP
jgi:hypothetical protein